MNKLLLLLLMITTNLFASDSLTSEIINNHLKKYAESEHFSGIQISIKAGNHVDHYAAGYRARDSDTALTMNDLYDIGSITKSFTAALALMAESEGKLKLTDTLGKYITQYPHWSGLTLTGLLNMSTGIPNYSNAPKINYLMSQNLKQYWPAEQLLDLVYIKDFNPPLQPGYFYSNTGYVLLDMILTTLYKKSFDELLVDKIITPSGLKNTWYAAKGYTAEQLQRLARGYGYNVYDNPELVGKDVTENNLSWAAAAGALLATSEDVVQWIDTLFFSDKLLTYAQKKQMQQLISTSTGKPIEQTSKEDPNGFGLGIAQGYNEKTGHYWFYEGQTLGYRAFYMAVPCNKVIIVALFNSATNGENDHGGALITALYENLLMQNEALMCQAETVV